MNKEFPSQTSGPVPVLRLPAVKSRVGLGRSSIYSALARGEFPAPVKLGERAVGWIESDIDAWISTRINATRGRGAA
jgi:prophage regulatory protein